jgi:hypothetical protein
MLLVCGSPWTYALAFQRKVRFDRARSGLENQQTYPPSRQIAPESCPSRREAAESGVQIACAGRSICQLHQAQVWRNLVPGTTERDYGLPAGHLTRKPRSRKPVSGCGQGVCFVESESNLKSLNTGTPSCVANTSRFSNDGALMPRSIRLKKSTDVPSSSANCSWLSRLDDRISLSRFPNFSRRLAN